jgi:hypothetical protein
MAAIDTTSSLVQHDEHCQVCHREMTLDQKVNRETDGATDLEGNRWHLLGK